MLFHQSLNFDSELIENAMENKLMIIKTHLFFLITTIG